ncbi:MAG: TIGR02466 family protein [Pseudomonadota bacterium]
MTNPRGIEALFAVGVQFSEIPDALEMNAELKDEIALIRGVVPNSLPEGWSCNLYTTILSPMNVLERSPFRKLREHIVAESNAFALAYGFNIERHPLKINECWVNVYGQGDAQEVHLHRNSVISGIYYVAAPPGSGELLFHSPLLEMLEPPTTQTNIFNVPIRNVAPKPGTMILFRSSLRHSVKPTKGKEERISVAFNLTM